jgi:UDPglucose 6-dehydrogenase
MIQVRRGEVERVTTVSVIGLGKVGLCVSAALSDRGFRAIGFDVSERRVRAVEEGDPTTDEPELNAMLRKNRDRLSGTRDIGAAVRGSDLSYVIVPTPSEDSGAYSLAFVQRAFAEIGRALRDKDGYHLVSLASTVQPGATRGLIPHLEEASGKMCGRDFGLCYSPAFISLGQVIRDFRNPYFTLVGEFDDRSGSLLADFYARVVDNGAPCKRMGIESAELTKLAVNTYVTAKIAFANMLADLCERIPGGDVDAVADAIGADLRIGRRYLSGGLGFGGPCFPRDNAALSSFARRVGLSAPIAEAVDRENRARPARVLDHLGLGDLDGARVAVLGLSYKHGSNVIEASQSVMLARELAARGAIVRAYDRVAGDAARKAVGDEFAVEDDVWACLEDADVVMVTTPDPLFRDAVQTLAGRPVTVVDFWRLLAPESLGAGIRYIAVGKNSDDTAATAPVLEFDARDEMVSVNGH